MHRSWVPEHQPLPIDLLQGQLGALSIRYVTRIDFLGVQVNGLGMLPQCGQIGPSGQRLASKCSRAFSESWNWGLSIAASIT